MKPRFGVTKIRNPYVADDNPHRDGIYVETIRRTGRLNPGTWYRLTDGKGAFWELKADGCEMLALAEELEKNGKPAPWNPDDSVRAGELHIVGGLFAVRFIDGCSNGCVELFVEDDEWYHRKLTFDRNWLSDLRDVIDAAIASPISRKAGV